MQAIVAIVAGAAALAALLRRRGQLAGTTLLPAWWWALAACTVWSAAETAAGLWEPRPGHGFAPWRLAAVALSLCPVLAVLGAKRPQHAAWSFVVAALWGVISLPAAEAFFLQRGQAATLGDARSWLLWILITLGPINYLPTRQWLAALLLATGQALALGEHLPLLPQPLFLGQHMVGLLLACLAALVVRSPQSTPAAQGCDRLWRDFRDSFGLLWALRLQERVNAVAVANRWPLWLSWSGLCDSATGEPIKQIDPAIEPVLRTTMRGLLRRFVSGNWIAERLGHDSE